MSALSFPCTIFTTQNRMDDISAKDMHCGDLSAEQLKRDFQLSDISNSIDPYSLTRKNYQQMAAYRTSTWNNTSVSKQECINILFNEFREQSKTFSFHGPWQDNIIAMINHMQHKRGIDFSSMMLDSALREQILTDKSERNSSRILLRDALTKNIDWKNGYFPLQAKEKLTAAIGKGILPKFDRIKDRFNGMGISVHDTWATQITIRSLKIDKTRYRAVVHYKIQDHFGLDNQDIQNWKFRQFRLFRIWFVLQRYSQFAFRPFMTNMSATIEIVGEYNVKTN